MPSLSQQIPNFNIKIIFLIHFVFISLSSMGYWSSNAYLFYNSVFIFLLLWNILHTQHQESLQLAIAVNGVSIILDILLLVMNFPSSASVVASKLSAAIAILHLLARFFSIHFLVKILEDNGGSSGLVRNMFSTPRPESYENIDRTGSQQAPSGAYSYETAQQI